MLFSRDQILASGKNARRWFVRLILFLGGSALLLASMLVGFLFLLVSWANEAVNLLLIFAAKTVRPRKLEND
ncbi:MAG: hypothetical protein ABJF10_02115 [Chthoniobacter sp.]|uniref:hypothetical protein n=1 Tax=Chthoniobacter sp. TaxID=2510640 RepID=UPI0032AC7472